MEVNGAIEGAVSLQGTLIVNPSGSVEGPVEADVVEVSGFVLGNVTAHKRIVLKKTGILTGDVTTASFAIEKGGWFNGEIHLLKPQLQNR